MSQMGLRDLFLPKQTEWELQKKKKKKATDLAEVNRIFFLPPVDLCVCQSATNGAHEIYTGEINFLEHKIQPSNGIPGWSAT